MYWPGSCIERDTMLPEEICTLSAMVRWPSTMAAPPKVQYLADLGAAGDANAAGHRRMRADMAVVADLDLVVELDAVLDHGVGQRAAVDRWCWRRFRRRRRSPRGRSAES